MQQPAAQPPPPPTTTTTTSTTTTTPAITDPLDPAAQYMKRRKTALTVTITLLSLSVVVLVVGLISATRTGNVAVAGYYPGITLSFGAFLGIVGINLLENRRPMLIAAIIFISMGVIASFFCAIVDGIIAAEFIDRRPLLEGRCQFYGSGSGYAFDNYYTEVMCHSFNSKCGLRVKSNTCYCCDLHNCESPDYNIQYYEFTGVNNCWDVVHLHRLLWACVVLNVLGLFLGIITAAILGAFKDLTPTPNPCSQMSPSPAPPPHILYNPTQHVVTYAGFCPSGQALPAYPNYPLPMQHLGSYQAPSTPQPGMEGGSSTTCPSEESQPPSQAPTQPPSQGSSQEPGGYMLTPNAPMLYPSFGPFEKPPPYAC